MATFVTNRVVDPNVPLTQDKLAPLSAAGNNGVKTIDQWLQQVTDVTAVTATLTPVSVTRTLTGSLVTDFNSYQTNVANTTATLTPTSVTRTLTGQLVLNTDFSSYQTNTANTTANLTPTSVTRTLTSQLVLNTDFTNYQTNVSNTTATLTPTSVTRTLTGQLVLNTDSRLSDTRIPTDLSVTNDRVATNAAIAGTKINPNFGSQNIITTGSAGIGTTQLNERLTVAGNISASGTITANQVIGLAGSFGGNAATATALQNSRSLWGQSFNGTSDVTGSITTTGTISAAGNVIANTFSGNVNATNIGNGSVSNSEFQALSSVTSDIQIQLDSKVFNTDFNSYRTNVANTTATLTPTSVTRTLTGQLVLNTDSRLTDARTPTSHTHGNITNGGAIGATANAPIITTTLGVLTTGSFGSTANTFCQGNDVRLSDTRTPTNESVDNDKVATNAAIAGTKISPNFGSQNIVTTGNIGAGTATPNQKLTVVGNISATGSITANSFSGSINATNIGNGSVNNNEFQSLSGVTSDIQIQLDSKTSNTDFSNYRTSVANTTATLTPITTTRTLTGQLVLNTDSRLTDTRTPTDLSVTDGKVATTAAISGTKINPNFGSQNIVTTGRIGAGTTTPGYSLDVAGSGRFGGPNITTESIALEIGFNRTGNGFAYIDLVGDTTYSDYGLRMIRENAGANTNSEIVHRGTGNMTINAQDAGTLRFSTNNTTRMRITSGGNVGIGTNNPGSLLDISSDINTGNAPFLHLRNTSGANAGTFGPGIVFTNGVAGTAPFILQQEQNTASSLSIARSTSPFTRYLTITQAGNVGIGITNPDSTFTVGTTSGAPTGLDGSATSTLFGRAMIGNTIYGGRGSYANSDAAVYYKGIASETPLVVIKNIPAGHANTANFTTNANRSAAAGTFVKMSNAGNTGEYQNPALVGIAYNFSNDTSSIQASGTRVVGVFGEAIESSNTKAFNMFVEGGRFHGIAADAISDGNGVYGAITKGQCGTGNLVRNKTRYVIGIESEIISFNLSATPLSPRNFRTDHFKTTYLATVRTGDRPDAAFIINPNKPAGETNFNSGFLIPKGTIKCVEHTAFGCYETDLQYGLDLARGSYNTAAIAIPNNNAFRAKRNGADVDDNILFYGGDNTLYLGYEAVNGTIFNNKVSLQGPEGNQMQWLSGSNTVTNHDWKLSLNSAGNLYFHTRINNTNKFPLLLQKDPTVGVTIGTNLQFTSLPTSSVGLPSGSVWRDAAAGNVLKIVP